MSSPFDLLLDYFLRKGKWWAVLLVAFIVLKAFFGVFYLVPNIHENFFASDHLENVLDIDSIYGETRTYNFGFNRPVKMNDSTFTAFFIETATTKDSVRMAYFGKESGRDSVLIKINGRLRKVAKVRKPIFQYVAEFFG